MGLCMVFGILELEHAVGSVQYCSCLVKHNSSASAACFLKLAILQVIVVSDGHILLFVCNPQNMSITSTVPSVHTLQAIHD